MTREVKSVAVFSVYDMPSRIPIGLLHKIANGCIFKLESVSILQGQPQIFRPSFIPDHLKVLSDALTLYLVNLSSCDWQY